MSFGKLQLPDFVLAGLYKDQLVWYNDVPIPTTTKEAIATTKLETVTSEKATTSPPKKWFLGDNNKQIVIMVNDAEAVFLRDEWLQFLSNILGACKLNIGDVAIINTATSNVDFNYINEQLIPKYMLLFDVEAKTIQLPFTVPYYQLQKFANISFLLAPSLSLMLGTTEAVKLEKSRLWVSLKNMFSI